MVFDEDFSTIIGGGNEQYTTPYEPPDGGVITGEENTEMSGFSEFGRQLHYWRQSALPEPLWHH